MKECMSFLTGKTVWTHETKLIGFLGFFVIVLFISLQTKKNLWFLRVCHVVGNNCFNEKVVENSMYIFLTYTSNIKWIINYISGTMLWEEQYEIWDKFKSPWQNEYVKLHFKLPMFSIHSKIIFLHFVSYVKYLTIPNVKMTYW